LVRSPPISAVVAPTEGHSRYVPITGVSRCSKVSEWRGLLDHLICAEQDGVGTAMPSALAARRLTRLNVLRCSMGRFSGFAPLSTLSTYSGVAPGRRQACARCNDSGGPPRQPKPIRCVAANPAGPTRRRDAQRDRRKSANSRPSPSERGLRYPALADRPRVGWSPE
jgi:hypothetical protein